MSTLHSLVLNYENPDLTSAAVASLQGTRNPPDSVLVVDNGSSETAFERLRALLPAAVQVLRLHENQGIPGALNAGVDRLLRAGPDAILIVMNDVRLDGVDCGALRDALAGEGVGAVAPVQCRADAPTVVHTAGGLLNDRWWTTSHRSNGASTDSLPDRLPDADFLDFSCVAVNAAAWRAVGELRADFKFYWDDVEWSLRARDAGFRLAMSTERCQHSVGGTMGTGVNPVALARSAHNRWATQRLCADRLSLTARVLAPVREAVRLVVHPRTRRGSRYELRGWWRVYVRRMGPGNFRGI